MTTVSVVATDEASNVPPRVRLDVTDVGSSPAYFAATVNRLDPGGRLVPVRTGDGNPLPLTTSGADRVGLLYDYEMPYGQSVSYTTVETPGSSSAVVTVDELRPWLVHPGVPGLSQPVLLRAGSFETVTLDVVQGVFLPLGRPHPVVITDGVRRSDESAFTVSTETLPALAALRALLADAATLLLNVPPAAGIDVDTAYISVGKVAVTRPSDIGMDPTRDVTLPYVVVDRPAGGSQAQRTWADVLAENATWADVLADYATWAELLAPTT